ncbi:MAG: hypothetical protein QNJ46_29600 [Leptolyngbyaceae cyanobacterium MO_188.B28]|nr:hypothetical protein [Leptolyngbyaceae cyanobacterium MO_188.B28]
MTLRVLTPEALDRALTLRDLSDPRQGPHAMQQIVQAIYDMLAAHWHCQRYLHRASPILSVAENYDRLGYPPDGAARNARYTRYVTATHLLRTMTSAMIPGLLQGLSLDPPDDLLLICPGLVYRRDTIDRLHTGEPHQLDLWRIKQGLLTPADLHEMIQHVIEVALPSCRYRVIPAHHPYTIDGLQIDVKVGAEWVEIGECGMTAPVILAQAGLDTDVMTGLAMGLGLDRMLMIRKGIDDIRLLRSEDSRVAKQMLDLSPYVRVSNQPPVRRDLSIAVDKNLMAEELGDRIREAMHDCIDSLESVEILDETLYENLPLIAHQRMGMRPGQKNVLLRLVIRHPVWTLTSEEANKIRDQVYYTVHQGNRMELAEQQKHPSHP